MNPEKLFKLRDKLKKKYEGKKVDLGEDSNQIYFRGVIEKIYVSHEYEDREFTPENTAKGKQYYGFRKEMPDWQLGFKLKCNDYFLLEFINQGLKVEFDKYGDTFITDKTGKKWFITKL